MVNINRRKKIQKDQITQGGVYNKKHYVTQIVNGIQSHKIQQGLQSRQLCRNIIKFMEDKANNG